jgi:hypothetical protein
MNIYEIKRRTEETSPHYFTRKTLKFFGQTLKDFSVTKRDDGRYDVVARIQIDGRPGGYSRRIFNPENNRLEHN